MRLRISYAVAPAASQQLNSQGKLQLKNGAPGHDFRCSQRSLIPIFTAEHLIHGHLQPQLWSATVDACQALASTLRVLVLNTPAVAVQAARRLWLRPSVSYLSYCIIEAI